MAAASSDPCFQPYRSGQDLPAGETFQPSQALVVGGPGGDPVGRYRAGLAGRDITLDERIALDQYRLFSAYSWTGCTIAAAMGSRWQPIEIGYNAMVRTTEAIADLDAVGLLTERLDSR